MIKDNYEGAYLRYDTDDGAVKIPLFQSFTENVSNMTADRLGQLDFSRKISIPANIKNMGYYDSCWAEDEDLIFDVALRIILKKFVFGNVAMLIKEPLEPLTTKSLSLVYHMKMSNGEWFDRTIVILDDYSMRPQMFYDAVDRLTMIFSQNVLNPQYLHVEKVKGGTFNDWGDSEYKYVTDLVKHASRLWDGQKYSSVGMLVIRLAEHMLIHKDDSYWWNDLFDPKYFEMMKDEK